MSEKKIKLSDRSFTFQEVIPAVKESRKDLLRVSLSSNPHFEDRPDCLTIQGNVILDFEEAGRLIELLIYMKAQMKKDNR